MADSGESIQLTIDTSYSIIATFFKEIPFGFTVISYFLTNLMNCAIFTSECIFVYKGAVS